MSSSVRPCQGNPGNLQTLSRGPDRQARRELLARQLTAIWGLVLTLRGEVSDLTSLSACPGSLRRAKAVPSLQNRPSHSCSIRGKAGSSQAAAPSLLRWLLGAAFSGAPLTDQDGPGTALWPHGSFLGLWRGWSLLPDGIWDALGPFPSAFLCLVMSVLGHGLPITKMASPLSLLFSIKMHFGDLNSEIFNLES